MKRRWGGRRSRQAARPRAAEPNAPTRRQRMVRGLEVAAAAAAVATAVIAAGRFVIDSSGDLLRTDSSHLEVRQVVVMNGPVATRFAAGKIRQLGESMPQLDITLRNTGRLPALVTAARVTVEDSERLGVCDFGGGPVQVSGSYAITLPLLPLLSERAVTRPLHQEVPAGEVDRFRLAFRLPWNTEENYVYALRVELISEDSGQPIDVGRFVLGVPETVNRGGRILPEGSDPFGFYGPSGHLISSWCGHRNIAALERLLAADGRRSSSMAALAEFRPAAWWKDFPDPRPPRAAAESVLAADAGVLAVFAAEQAGDPSFVAATKSRAAAMLLDSAEDSLRFDSVAGARAAIVSIRYALLFDPSPEANQLLSRAEAELEVREAELAEMEAEARQ
ncbi:MAG TPA: hypothetical protein VFM51_07575 [Solirubrobacterales bacterium]|nr:hypothetical protein [Solirubrobacterales bacterium]